jgi:RNA polymerase sigma-70 factor (ECF subfamily)
MLDRETADASQANLLRRIAAQDRQALADLYDETAGMVYSVAFRILGDVQEAEEVIQDVFVQIWNNAATFDGTLGAPFSWALGITRNRSIDRLRARQRRLRLSEELQETSAVVNDPLAVSPEASCGEDERLKIRSAVSELPDEQRQAIELAFFTGLTHAEIAVALNQPLGTIKARIRRGMLKLRENLERFA